MNEIITQLIAAAIDENKIPGLDYFELADRKNGRFSIILNDGTEISITVETKLP